MKLLGQTGMSKGLIRHQLINCMKPSGTFAGPRDYLREQITALLTTIFTDNS